MIRCSQEIGEWTFILLILTWCNYVSRSRKVYVRIWILFTQKMLKYVSYQGAADEYIYFCKKRLLVFNFYLIYILILNISCINVIWQMYAFDLLFQCQIVPNRTFVSQSSLEQIVFKGVILGQGKSLVSHDTERIFNVHRTYFNIWVFSYFIKEKKILSKFKAW